MSHNKYCAIFVNGYDSSLFVLIVVLHEEIDGGKDERLHTHLGSSSGGSDRRALFLSRPEHDVVS